MIKIEVKRTVKAPINFVFNKITDHANYKNFSGVKDSSLLNEGKTHKNGVGALRFVDAGFINFDEEIVGFEENALLQYRIVRSSPFTINHVLGDVRMSENEEGTTDVLWTSELSVPLPILGKLIEGRLLKQSGRAFAAILKSIEAQYG